MSKIEKLLDKTKRNSETKKWKMYLVVVLVILVVYFSLGLYLYAWGVWDVVDSKATPHRYEFYDEMAANGHDGKIIYFIGDSMTGHAMYPREINLELQKHGFTDIKTYNLVENGGDYCTRITEVNKIIKTNPDLVILGVTYSNLNSGLVIEDRIILAHSRLDIAEDSLYLFTDKEKEVFKKIPDFIFLKSYLDSAKEYKKTNTKPWGSKSFWNYYDIDYNSIRVTSDDLNGDLSSLSRGVNDRKALEKEVSGTTGTWYPKISREMTRQKEALLYFVNKLEESGIKVVLINMPLHPLVSEKITNETRENFYDLLNQTGASWYDYEQSYDDDFFQDSHHASKYGGMIFAPVITNLIIQELT